MCHSVFVRNGRCCMGLHQQVVLWLGVCLGVLASGTLQLVVTDFGSASVCCMCACCHAAQAHKACAVVRVRHATPRKSGAPLLCRDV